MCIRDRGYDVIACCIDVGEGKDLEAIKEKGLKVGAVKSVSYTHLGGYAKLAAPSSGT